MKSFRETLLAFLFLHCTVTNSDTLCIFRPVRSVTTISRPFIRKFSGGVYNSALTYCTISVYLTKRPHLIVASYLSVIKLPLNSKQDSNVYLPICTARTSQFVVLSSLIAALA